MSHRVLVTYASRGGSTAGVAEVIGQTLTDSGMHVDVCSVQDVHDLSPYQSVVIGSAIQGGAWLPEAMEFVQRHHAALAQKPCAIFLACMTLSMRGGEQYRSHVATWLDPVRRLITPVSEGLFAGALNLDRIPSFGDKLKFRLSILFGMWSEGDHRDWNAIRAWAQSLVLKFQKMQQPDPAR